MVGSIVSAVKVCTDLDWWRTKDFVLVQPVLTRNRIWCPWHLECKNQSRLTGTWLTLTLVVCDLRTWFRIEYEGCRQDLFGWNCVLLLAGLCVLVCVCVVCTCTSVCVVCVCMSVPVYVCMHVWVQVLLCTLVTKLCITDVTCAYS